MDSNLRNEIVNLIEQNKEGVYYDFKRQYPPKSIDLLKDILSLANCKYEGDRYLIIGVGEIEGNFQVIGLNDSNRRTQSDLQDFLDNQSFAGENIPKVELKTLNLENVNKESSEIDVIIIKNTRCKPYYLRKCEEFNPHTIWTRHNDKNSVAHYFEAEEMWKERIGLTNDVKKNFKNFLTDYNNWEYNEKDNLFYYLPNSDYYIKFNQMDYSENMREPFSKFYLDDTFFKCNALFKVRNTVIFSCEFIYCDGFGTKFPCPSLKPINFNEFLDGFYYYLTDDLVGLFAKMLYDKYGFSSRFYEFPCLFFNNEEEVNSFSYFLEEFDEELEVPINFYPIGAFRENNYFRNVDLERLRKNVYIYEFYYQK